MNNAEALASVELTKALQTTDLSTGLLSDEQARHFVRQVFAATPVFREARAIPMHARKMNVDRLGVGQRLLRKRPEGTALATMTRPTTSQAQLSAVDLQLPWEVTEVTFTLLSKGQSRKPVVPTG